MYQLVLVPRLSANDANKSRYGYGCSGAKFGSDSCIQKSVHAMPAESKLGILGKSNKTYAPLVAPI